MFCKNYERIFCEGHSFFCQILDKESTLLYFKKSLFFLFLRLPVEKSWKVQKDFVTFFHNEFIAYFDIGILTAGRDQSLRLNEGVESAVQTST